MHCSIIQEETEIDDIHMQRVFLDLPENFKSKQNDQLINIKTHRHFKTNSNNLRSYRIVHPSCVGVLFLVHQLCASAQDSNFDVPIRDSLPIRRRSHIFEIFVCYIVVFIVVNIFFYFFLRSICGYGRDRR
jgi:hypothetical protein